MNHKSLFAVIVMMFFLNSCGNRKPVAIGDEIKLGFINDGRMVQASEEIKQVRRIHFTASGANSQVLGSEIVEGHESVNADSLPEDLKSKYYGIFVSDKEGQILFKSILDKNFYFSEHPDSSDYWVMKTISQITIDIPLEIELNEIGQIGIADLETNTVILPLNGQDVSREYIPPQVSEEHEGWDGDYKVYKLFGTAKAENAFDIVLLTDGFTHSELDMSSKESLLNSKFGSYYQRYVLPLMDTDPYKNLKDKVNIWVVATPSKDSGVSNPMLEIKKRTVYGSMFGAHCMMRSLVVRNQTRAIELASKAPFDQVIVMVNSEIYGGQGGDIATFSMHPSANYLIKHELAHAIGMMADEYSNFSDANTVYSENEKKERESEIQRSGVGQEVNICQITNSEDYVTHKHKNWGRNYFFEQDNYLAPNISLNSDLESVKWRDYLNENSPVVFMDYAIGGYRAEAYENEFTKLSALFEAGFSRNELILTLGINKMANSSIQLVKEVYIGDEKVEFEIVTEGEKKFIKVMNREINVGENIEVSLILLLSPEAISDSTFKYFLHDKHFFKLTSRTFAGGLEMGIFQGSGPDMKRTFRSSYDNIMGTHNLEFNDYQKDAYSLMIQYFTR